MRIETFQGRADDAGARAESNRRVSLQLLLRQPTDKQRRPCPGCDLTCACSQRSTTCCCGCSASCPNAAAMLSSEPQRYPIEPRVLPLVYALTTLRVVETCWSCEGHAGDAGRVAKTPQVWFYAESTSYPELIAQHAQDLLTKRELSRPWCVTVSPFAACDVTTFNLRPVGVRDARLGDLQADLARLAADLVPSVRDLAQQSLRTLGTRRAPNRREHR